MRPKLIHVATALIAAGYITAGAATLYRHEHLPRDELRQAAGLHPTSSVSPSRFPGFAAMVERTAPTVVNITTDGSGAARLMAEEVNR